MKKLSLRSLQTVIIGIILMLASGYTGYWLGINRLLPLGAMSKSAATALDRSIPDGKPADFSLFWRTWDDLHRLYVDRSNLDQNQLVYGAIQGMVSAAGDPYTMFLPPTENKQAKEDLGGSFGGVGIELGYKDKTLAVIAPLSGTPADKAGVKSGDLIIKITDKIQKVDKTTDGLSLPEAVSLIRGPEGSNVTLTLVRDGATKPFDVTLTRSVISVKTVETKMESCGNNCEIPVVKISRFGEKTDTEWDTAVTTILTDKKAGKNIPAVILDLRNDPGGYLDQAVNIASDFISSGPVVWQAGIDQKFPYNVTRSPRLKGFKTIALINGGSASAAEILSGALSEQAGTILVGEKSFGKGSVQQPEDLPGGAGLHVTIAKWLLPSGKSIDKVGITPKYIVLPDDKDQTNDTQLKKALELAR